MSTAHVLDALLRLEGMAVAGLPPDDVAREAELIAAGWWRDGRGDLGPDRLVPLVQELRHWCVVASGRHAARWGHLHRMGRPLDAREAARWAGGAGPGATGADGLRLRGFDPAVTATPRQGAT